MFGDNPYLRGDVFALKAAKAAKGHEQRGHRYAVVLQSSDLRLSSVIVAPTSTGSKASSFRPEISINGQPTRVLVEQMSAVDPEVRFGQKVTHLSFTDMKLISRACAKVLEL